MKILLSIVFILLPLSISSKEIILKCTNSENHFDKIIGQDITERYFRYSKVILRKAKIEKRVTGKWIKWCKEEDKIIDASVTDEKRLHYFRYTKKYELTGLGGKCTVTNSVSWSGEKSNLGLCDVGYALDFEYPKRSVFKKCHNFKNAKDNDKDFKFEKGWECSQVKKVTQE